MLTQSDTRVTIRVDRELKERAEILFARLGMNMSTALNVFLRKAVDEGAIPFIVGTTKNSGAGYKYPYDDITDAFTSAVQVAISENQRKGFPVARYDAVSRQAYLEAADGTREYVHA